MSFLGQQLFGKHRFRQLVVVLLTLILTMALALTAIESDAKGTRIHNLGDGLWWSVVTMTTVGYGDVVPVTPLGRAVASVLVVVGSALYLTIFVIVGTTISESHDRYHWHRTDERLDMMEKQLSGIQKTLEYLVHKPDKAKHS